MQMSPALGVPIVAEQLTGSGGLVGSGSFVVPFFFVFFEGRGCHYGTDTIPLCNVRIHHVRNLGNKCSACCVGFHSAYAHIHPHIHTCVENKGDGKLKIRNACITTGCGLWNMSSTLTSSVNHMKRFEFCQSSRRTTKETRMC